MRRAVYPGTFDPVTLGHLDIVRRGQALFDEVVVAVIENPRKRPLFTVAERVDLFREALRAEGDMPRGDKSRSLAGTPVRPFAGLLVDFIGEVEASVILRGLRFVSDFEYEFQMALMNNTLGPGIETLFLVTGPEKAFLSSTLVKEVAGLGRDVSKFVPPNVAAALAEKLRGRKTNQGHTSGEEN